MNNTLVVEIRSVYGEDRIYPVNEQAINVCTLLGQKTITKRDVPILKTMGFNIELSNPTPTFL